MNVHAFGSWVSALQCLVFDDFERLTEVLTLDVRLNDPGMSVGHPTGKLPLEAAFPSLIILNTCVGSLEYLKDLLESLDTVRLSLPFSRSLEYLECLTSLLTQSERILDILSPTLRPNKIAISEESLRFHIAKCNSHVLLQI